MKPLTGKERSYLAGLSSRSPAIFQVGKDGVTDAMIRGLSSALEARELIKVNVLKSADFAAAELADRLAAALTAQVVRTVGNKVILYRPSTKKNVDHILPAGNPSQDKQAGTKTRK